LVLHQVLHWVNSTVAGGCCVKLNEMGIWKMNEQMQKLELEAIAYADSKVPAMDRYNDIYHSIVRGKFAELIVKECAEVGLDSVEDGDDLDAIMKRVHNNILKHFGVEE
jgi:hypothetical protein